MLVELVSVQVTKMIHDDVQAPEHNLLFKVGLLCLWIGSNVIENPYQKPHPKIVLSCLCLALSIVDSVFQEISTYAQQHCYVCVI